MRASSTRYANGRGRKHERTYLLSVSSCRASKELEALQPKAVRRNASALAGVGAYTYLEVGTAPPPYLPCLTFRQADQT